MAAHAGDVPGRVQILAAVVICTAVFAGGWIWVVAPARAVLAARESRAPSVRAAVARARAAAAARPARDRTLDALEASLQQASVSLPDRREPDALLRRLQDLAVLSDSSLTQFTPRPLVTRADYAEWPIDLAIDGAFHDVARFLDRVSNMSPLVSIADLHIKANLQPAAERSISASCTVTTYVVAITGASVTAAGGSAPGRRSGARQ